MFIGFHVLEEDPLWKPSTQEELADYGDTFDKENIAKKYVDMVNKRKGKISTRTIMDGEKTAGSKRQ